MSDLLPQYRIASGSRALHHSYEKAGLVVHDQPIPWNADAVLVESDLRLPHAEMRRPADYTLLIPGREPVVADGVHRLDGEDDRYAVGFRIAPPAQRTTATLRWREHELGRLDLLVLSREQFLTELRLQLPTLQVRIGEEIVACKTFVPGQCGGLLASALLTSPTSLAPLADLDLAVVFKDEREGTSQRVAVRLNHSQLASRGTLLCVWPRKHPRRLGVWSATWTLAERELARQEVRGISLRQFHKSLRVSATRYVLVNPDGAVTVVRSLPTEGDRRRVGPCFLVCSREAGMAGLCSLRVATQVTGSGPPTAWEQEVLITDGPVVVAPGTIEPAALEKAQTFDLVLQGKVMSTLPLRPAPSAKFTTEGGFEPAAEFAWNSATDDELDQRLGRLLEDRFRGK